MGTAPPPPIVTITALYGAGGSDIGPRVAEALGVQYLDRRAVDAAAYDEGGGGEDTARRPRVRRDRFARVAGTLSRLSTVTGEGGGGIERLDLFDRSARGANDQFFAGCRDAGGVALGHGSLVVLAGVPWALHVLLFGPRQARALAAASKYGIEEAEAFRRLLRVDRERVNSVRRDYGVNPADPSQYQLALDSTALSVDACVDVIVTAARARVDRTVTE